MNARYTPQNYQPSRLPRPRQRKFRRHRFTTFFAVTGIFSCIVALAVLVGYYFIRSQDVISKPLVLINAPNSGQQFEVGQVTSVQAVARDPNKITRFELWVDGQLHKTDTSSIPGGTSPFPMLTDWQPLTQGPHTITVRAFNGYGMRSQASVTVESVVLLDQDKDGVADEMDACPDQPGYSTAEGCPDRDLDGIADGVDLCPEESGLTEIDGCPGISEGDRDGDGVLDGYDLCPDEPGPALTEGCPDSDGDTIPDLEDACPDEAGWADHDGCPTPGDSDGDGLLDGEDACPEERGPGDTEGCPDEDGDGIPDHEDACPSVPGPAETRGCPDIDGDTVPDEDDLAPGVPGGTEEGGAPPGPDRDGDGAPDDADPCPDEYGEAEDGYCPPPDSDVGTDEDSSFFEIPPFGMDFGTPVEFQALEFSVDEYWGEVWCYIGVGTPDDEVYRRIEFTPEPGVTNWDLRTYLGEEETSHLLWVQEDDVINVNTECSGIPPGSSGPPIYLYGSSEIHFSSDWHGEEIVTDYRHAEGVYRLCRYGCENDYLPPPFLQDAGIGSDRFFRRDNYFWHWAWPAEREAEIQGFKVYLNDNFVEATSSSEYRTLEIPLTEPACGESITMRVSAYIGVDARAPEIESLLSNPITVDRPPCPRTIRVRFRALNVHGLPADERGRHTPGPLTGNFWASTGSGVKSLEFDGAHCIDAPIGRRCWGLRLREDDPSSLEDYTVMALFDWIQRELDACTRGPCPGYYAPGTDNIIIEIEPGDDLNVGAHILDHDENNPNDNLFKDEITIDPDTLLPGSIIRLPIPGSYLDVHVEIELLSNSP